MSYSQITINGQVHRLRKPDARRIRLVRKGKRLKEKIEALQKELQQINQELIALASQHRGNETIVRLDGIDCYASVVFGQTIHFDPGKMQHIEQETPQELFEELFIKQVTYKPREALELFLQGKQKGEFARIKEDIVNAMVIKDKKPGVKYYAKQNKP